MAQENHSSSEKIRVLIAHDVRVIHDGIASLLGQSPLLTVVELPQQETKSKEKHEGGAVDVVLAFSELTTSATIDQIQKIKNTFPDTKVVIIGVLGTEKESLECIEAGASGYVLPESRPEDLVETIQIVHRGEATCPPDMIARLFERVASLHTQLKMAQENELSSLTHRELEVLQLVTEGMSNKEIATHLKLELQTVKNHVHNILEKLRVRNRQEAIACTRKFKIVVGSK
jgi:two-component system nitrate/nitrite response regulator NarL